jgi:hypothetical protein
VTEEGKQGMGGGVRRVLLPRMKQLGETEATCAAQQRTEACTSGERAGRVRGGGELQPWASAGLCNRRMISDVRWR